MSGKAWLYLFSEPFDICVEAAQAVGCIISRLEVKHCEVEDNIRGQMFEPGFLGAAWEVHHLICKVSRFLNALTSPNFNFKFSTDRYPGTWNFTSSTISPVA